MEVFSFIFALLLVGTGVCLILSLRTTLRGDPPPDVQRDRRWAAYEERRMRVRRDRVWRRVESLHSEFNGREAAGGTRAEHPPARRPARGGDAEAVTPGDLMSAFEQFAAARRGRRRDEPPPAG